MFCFVLFVVGVSPSNAPIVLVNPAKLPVKFEFKQIEEMLENIDSGNLTKIAYQFNETGHNLAADKKLYLHFSVFENSFYIELLSKEKLNSLSNTAVKSPVVVQEFLQKLGDSWVEFMRLELRVQRKYLNEFYCLDIQDAVADYLRKKRLDEVTALKIKIRSSYPNLAQKFDEVELGDIQPERSVQIRQIFCFLTHVFNYEFENTEKRESEFTKIKETTLTKLEIPPNHDGLEPQNAEELANHMINIGEAMLKTHMTKSYWNPDLGLQEKWNSLSVDLRDILDVGGGDDLH